MNINNIFLVGDTKINNLKCTGHNFFTALWNVQGIKLQGAIHLTSSLKK